ncbi:hypothetical protein PC116_g33499 [Phytophthora cactorum]|nr:hypothetical protein PC116_g33499 [Phytophthora cactorum]
MDLTLSLCMRKFVLGETEAGGFGGGFILTAGVKGGSIWPAPFARLNGDEEGGANS